LYQLVKPLLFAIEAERAHHLTMAGLQVVTSIPPLNFLLKKSWDFEDPSLQTNKMGLHFRNPVGLAAGFDKNGAYIDSLASLGFGFIEVGTVTPVAQPGNAQPRLFRLPADRALINRMGFNNAGVDHLVENLRKVRSEGLIVGGNIGKNKLTLNEKAVEDYLMTFRKLFDYVHYFVVNVSSPNTPGLRSLQDKEPLRQLLRALQDENKARPAERPILLKIAPDLSSDQLDDVLDVVLEQGLNGIIATNTTLSREGLKTPVAVLEKIGAGGLSGAPLADRATELIRHIRKNTNPDFVIVGVGGIMSVDEALRKIDHGADLLQIYTGLIYQGPAFIRQINQAIAMRRQENG
jgi:dihydroorotate dehydrogenase